jgi:hypothetical protein
MGWHTPSLASLLPQALARQADKAPPAELQDVLPLAKLIGQARLSVWGFKIYDARLWSPPGLNPRNFASQPMALDLAYLRDFTAADDQFGAPPTALVSHNLWRTRFGANPAVLNQTIDLDGRAVRIIGVLPRDFELPNLSETDILRPFQRDPKERGAGLLRVYGRLKPGVTVVEARTRLVPLFQRSFPAAVIVARQDPPDPRTQSGDWQIAGGSLMRWLRPKIEKFPEKPGFLTVDPALRDKWRARLDELGPGKKIEESEEGSVSRRL